MRPLSDVRIVAIEQYGAGPFATMHLADLGAEIIKIEDPTVGGDVGRYVPPFTDGEDSLFFEAFNRNKRSIALDIRNRAGRRVFERLVTRSDAVFSNLRGDVPEKLGIRYDDLRALNPAIVCCSLSGFGMASSRRTDPSYDYMLQGIAGWMGLTGEPDGPPTKSGLSLVDYSGGLVAALSLMAALHGARRDGQGTDCDISLYDTAISLLTYPAAWYLTAGHQVERTRHSAHPSLVPFQNFATSDRWIVVGCAKEKFWHRLVEVMELPELADEEHYATFAGRRERRSELLERLEARFLERSSAEWLKALREAGVPCAPVNNLAEALEDPLAEERGMITETDHPRFGTVRGVATATRVGPPGADRVVYRRAPSRGEDADYVLRDLLGFSEAEVGGLQQSGAFGPEAL